MKPLFAACLSSLLPTALLCAALTPEQAIKVRNISGLTFSADGSHLAFVVSDLPSGQTPASHIWMLDVSAGQARQFTASSKTESSPRWSPDGRTLAFLSNRDERMQIYLIPRGGGEAMPLTSGKNAVSSFCWSPDGTQIAFAAALPPSEADEKKEKDKNDAKVADRPQDLLRLWTVDATSKKVRQVTHDDWKVTQFEWISASKLVVVASEHPKSEQWDEALYTVSTDDGKFALLSKPDQPFGGLSVSPDLNQLAFTGTRSGGPHPHDQFLQSVKQPTARDVTAALDRPVHAAKWQPKETLFISVADGFRNRLYRLAPGLPPAPMETPGSLADFDVAPNGLIAFVKTGFDCLPDLFLQEPGGASRQVTHLQPNWADVNLATAEIFQFKSFDGKPVEAALMKPKKPAAGKGKPPLVLYVHGGPAGNFSQAYSSWAQLLVDHGYQVLMVNPRGSSGYGEEFLKANRNDWGGGDFKDLMAAVDVVLARGEVDPNRLGIGGWSYGGYMAEWAITQTNRFKVAVSGAGMFDLAAEFGTEVGPAGDEWYFGTPWEHLDNFQHGSPQTYIKNAKTPTLILQGENDPIDPIGQSTSLYRALKRYGVETELVTYPREPHGFREEKHQVDVLLRMLAWFDRYLQLER